jgi:uncharacterized protein
LTGEEAERMGGEKTSETRVLDFYNEIGNKEGSERAKQHEGTTEAEEKTSSEETGQRDGQHVKKLI